MDGVLIALTGTVGTTGLWNINLEERTYVLKRAKWMDKESTGVPSLSKG